MSEVGTLTRFRRNWEFGRHVGVQRVARRLHAQMRRAIDDRLGERISAGVEGPSPAPHPPLPLFSPRASGLERGPGFHRFTFQNRTVAMGPSVDWSAPGPGPRDQLWRMSLHYMEYLEAVDDAGFAALIGDWLSHVPASGAGKWRDSFNSYALSIRVVVWMQQLALRRDNLPPAFVADMCASLAQQLRFLERNLETDIGGNHLVKNVKALLWASAFFIGADAQRWRSKGVRLLRDILAEQILPDGMHYERSPSYHCQVLADLLECRHALGEDPFLGVLDRMLSRMAQAAADLAHPDGTVALFNDSGVSMAYAPHECLAVHARLLGHAPGARERFALPAAGYFGRRNERMHFVADCGRIGPDELVAHAHGDILSFEWSVGGKRVIVDQGVYEYSAGERRARARSARSHNTLAIEGADQADFFGAFRCGRRPAVKARRFEEAADDVLLEGEHDGFAVLPGKPRHVRRFEVSGRGIAIQDRIAGECRQAASIGFLLHPECAVEVADCRAFIRRDDARIVLDCSAPLVLEEAVWWPDMGVEVPTRRLRAFLPGSGQGIMSRLVATCA